jgi:hypothetical protein
MHEQPFVSDRTYEVVAWPSGPLWLLEVGDLGATQVYVLADAERMAQDYVASLLDVDLAHIRVRVVRGIGPGEAF